MNRYILFIGAFVMIVGGAVYPEVALTSETSMGLGLLWMAIAVLLK